ncbi:hypothetical protein GCM10020255_007000 [Rhodococcus baikonurensis]
MIRGAVVPSEAIRSPQVAATFPSPPEEVLQARPRGCKQVVAERVEQERAVVAERAAVVEQERVAAVPPRK